MAGDVEGDVMGCTGETFEECAKSIFDENEVYCDFFTYDSVGTSNMWLWIVIVIILLIVIAAVVFWIRKKQGKFKPQLAAGKIYRW